MIIGEIIFTNVFSISVTLLTSYLLIHIDNK
jgi:hypothetical protein